MANMNIISRVTNLLKGFLSIFIRDIETANPEIAYENAIAAMIGKYTKLKNATAALIARRRDIEERLNKAVTAKEKAEMNLEAALSLDDEKAAEELGTACIQAVDAATEEIAQLSKELEVAQKDCEDAKAGMVEIQQEIKKLKGEQHRQIARLQSAEARNRINEQIEGLSDDADVQALDAVREHIKTTVAKADLSREMSETDLEVRLKRLSRNAGDITSKQKFAALRAEKIAHAKSVAQLQELVDRSENRKTQEVG